MCRCGAPHEAGDNFCRRCGHALTISLPRRLNIEAAGSARDAMPPSLIGSVAVLAMGTGLEWLARRSWRSAARAAGRALVPGRSAPRPR